LDFGSLGRVSLTFAVDEKRASKAGSVDEKFKTLREAKSDSCLPSILSPHERIQKRMYTHLHTLHPLPIASPKPNELDLDPKTPTQKEKRLLVVLLALRVDEIAVLVGPVPES